MIRPDLITRRPRGAGSRTAFSLFELVGVLVILGVLAGTAIPVVSSITGLKVEAVRAEVSASLVFARETAAATGLPTGVRMDISTQEMGYVQISALGAAPAPMLDVAGIPRQSVRVDRNGGAGFEGVTGASGVGADRIVWFGLAGVPQLRAADGSFSQEAPSDAVIAFTSGENLTVRAHTGLIE